MVECLIKSFNQLSTNELYDILHLRSDVFVVEQNCIYQDIDYKDQKALHILLKKNNKLIGYTRIFKNGDYFKNASIGRVLVCKNNRNHNYGTQLMEVSIKAIKIKFKESKISISAQTYLKQFYNNLGFKVSGEEYLEDGIPHIAMIKTNL